VGSAKLVVFRSFPLGTTNTQVDRAIIVVHGTGRNGDDYFVDMMKSAKQAGADRTTVVVAPVFQASGSGDDLYWTDGDWREGGDGTSQGGQKVSSYTALDALANLLADGVRFPAVRKLIITGHSAGGQVVQRYAVAARKPPTAIPVRFVPANPSSYVYLDSLRLVGGTWSRSGSRFSACPSYDDYKFGLRNRGGVPYVAAQSDDQLRSQYAARDVVYLLGTADTCNSKLDASCDDHTLDTGCEAMLQGDFRLQRGDNYWEHLGRVLPGHRHTRQYVEGVGHDHLRMYSAPDGAPILFR
jgi:pimeloyl-ACP methyl ester carboxylesterase